MLTVVQTATFSRRLDELANTSATARIVVRLRRLELGNPGDVKSVGGGVSELRIDYGPGYRVYFTQRGKTLVILLCGGDKRSQAKDIKTAQRMAKEFDVPPETTKFDVLDHLKTVKEQIAYLEAALDEDDPSFIATAIGDVRAPVA